MAATLTADQLTLAEVIEADPVWFSENVLGHDPWETPRAIMRAMTRPRARVAVKACHSSAKTHTAADIVLWWVATGGIAVTTAPTWTQVEKLLWGEIRKAHQGARYPIGGTLLNTELRLGPDCYALGLSTNEGVRFQGWHGRVLLVLDEAPGVRPGIYEAIEGIRAGGDVRVLLLGNPVIPSGPFYDAFTTQRAGWRTFTIDAFDTPNFVGLGPTPEARKARLLALADDDEELDVAPRPYLTTRRWVAERYRDLDGDESAPDWCARVRGQFPDQAEDALLSLAWLETSRWGEAEPGPDDAWEAGIDVAGPGEDETVVAIRHGPRLVLLRGWKKPDPRGEVLAALEPYRDALTRLKVDAVGIGYYFARHLEDNGYAGRVVDVNVGAATTDPERYLNLRSELYWAFRSVCREGRLAGLEDAKAISQLAGIRYEHDARGRVVIESKDDARKRGVKSPDLAEGLLLCYTSPPVVIAGGVHFGAVKGWGF